MKLAVLHPGPKAFIEWKIIPDDADSTLSELQATVGGYVETVGMLVPELRECLMWVDEEGLIKWIGQNAFASFLTGQYIVGTAVVTSGEVYERLQELTPAQAKKLSELEEEFNADSKF